MPDTRLPKQMFYGQMKDGKRHQGGPKRRFKDVMKEHLKETNMDYTSWEDIARDKEKWRAAVQWCENS